MKILKNPEAVIYDTSNLKSKEPNPCKSFENLTPLHHCHEKTDYEFLYEYFPKDHPIFKDFNQSFYYLL